MAASSSQIGGRLAFKFHDIDRPAFKGWSFLPAQIRFLEGLTKKEAMEAGADIIGSKIKSKIDREIFEPAFTLNIASWFWKGPQGQFIYQADGLFKIITNTNELFGTFALLKSPDIANAMGYRAGLIGTGIDSKDAEVQSQLLNMEKHNNPKHMEE
jgi:hypothetical protein